MKFLQNFFIFDLFFHTESYTINAGEFFIFIFQKNDSILQNVIFD